ncbi:MAG: ABC transporter ATP-binding protein [Bacilli bacterium]|nr:ABC transporter ATP-binding protein [Bacilli bacterium]
MGNILKSKNLTKYYGENENLVKAIDNVNISIKKGEFVAIVGKSGSGKSTLLHMLGGLDNPTSGDVIIDGQNIGKMKEDDLAIFRRKKIGFIFQYYNLIPSINVWENVVLPIGLDAQKVDKDFVNEVLQVLGVDGKKDSLPATLSGGQQQRVAIARAIVTKPAIIFADEPTGNLDSKTEAEVIKLLKLSAKKYDQTIVMITHDENIANMADRVITIEDGRVK